MKINDIANIRLANQQIIRKDFNTPKDIVGWMGAMQAQDYPMAKWAIGVRLPAATDKLVENAIDNGEIIRTHVLRPTWHLVSADDIYWMLALTAPRVKASMKSRQRYLLADHSNQRTGHRSMEAENNKRQDKGGN